MDTATDFGAVDSIVTKEYVEMERPEISTERGATRDIADALVNCHGKNAHQLFVQTYYGIATNPWNEKQAIQFLSAMQCKGNDSSFAFKNCEEDANDPCEKADYYLLTVGRVVVNSPSDRCMTACATTLCAFLRNCEDAPIHPSTLYLIVSFLLDKAASQTWSDQTTRSLALATHCLLSSNHWSSWDALDTLLQGPSFSLASPPFSAFLNHTLSLPDLSDTYRSQLFARLLLPFIHHPTSTKAVKPSFSSLWNAIRCLIQCVSPSIASPFFSLWVESCSACVQSALLPPDELESIVLFVVHRCSSSTLPYLVTSRCYKLLLLAAQSLTHNSTPSVSSPLVGFALQSLLKPDLNPHLQLILVTLLTSLQPYMTPEEMEATSKVLCHHLSIVLKSDLEKNAEVSHDESFRLLSACHPSLPTLILLLIAPLYSLFDSLLSLPPIASIVQDSLQRETDLLSLFSQHPIIDSLLPRLLPCCSSSFLHSLFESIQSHSEDEHSRTPLLRVLLGMPQFTSLHSTLLDTLLRLPSTPEAITQRTLFSRILITTHQQALIQPHIQAWLQLDDPLSLDGSLSPQLQLLTALPFSFLQETLIACSMRIRDSKEVYCVLRLLRVINAVSFQRHKEQAKQHEAEASEEMNPLKMERLLNMQYCQTGIFSCYRPFVERILRTFVNGETECDVRVMRELCLLCSDVQSHCWENDSLYELFVEHCAASEDLLVIEHVFLQAFACLVALGVDETRLRTIAKKTLMRCVREKMEGVVMDVLGWVMSLVVKKQLLEDFVELFAVVEAGGSDSLKERVAAMRASVTKYIHFPV